MLTPREATAALIEKYRDNPNEFQMLKGVLCASHIDGIAFPFDTMMIATRMDEMNAISIARHNKPSLTF